MLVPNVRNPFFAELVVGVEEWCRQAGYSVFLCNSDNDPKHQQSYLRTLLEKVRIVCTVYDPASGKYRLNYGLFIELAVGIGITVVAGSWLAREWLRARRA